MKKRPKTSTKKYRPITLYKEDVKEILDVFTEPNDITIREIIIDEYEISDFNELEKLDIDKTKLLSVSTSDPHINLELSRHRASITTYDESPIAFGIVYAINEILVKKQRMLSFNRVLVTSAISYLLLTLGSSLWLDASLDLYIFIGAFCAFNLFMLFIVKYFGNNHTHIYLKASKHHNSVFKRKKDEIIIGAVFLVFGVVLKSLFDHILK